MAPQLLQGFPGALFLRSWLLIAIAGAGAVTGCVGQVEGFRDLGPQAYYQTGFPFQDTSGPLEEAFRAVKRIQVSTTYQIYLFDRESAPLEGETLDFEVLSRAVDTLAVPSERAASAVVLSRADEQLLLITVGHALTFPDTILSYFDAPETVAGGSDPLQEGRRVVESVAFKLWQRNWVQGLPDEDPFNSFEILVQDPLRDLALLGVNYPIAARTLLLPVTVEVPVPVLSVPTGDSSRLSLGSFVYVIGYPMGYPMVTRGIVSAPNDPIVGPSFLVDGLWNRGMSGGLVLAVRGDGGGFEWVGLAQAAVGTTEIRLVPEESASTQSNIRRPYDGPLFLEEVRRIEYGITYSIPTGQIRPFLDENRAPLESLGYNVPRF